MKKLELHNFNSSIFLLILTGLLVFLMKWNNNALFIMLYRRYLYYLSEVGESAFTLSKHYAFFIKISVNELISIIAVYVQ